jgi:phytanoyl-CoA hydroxylase
VGLVDHIRADGWGVVPEFFDPAECEAIAEAMTQRPFPELSPAARAWVADPRWPEVVLPLVRPDVRLARAQLLTKHPRTNDSVPWHQDNDFLPVDPPEFLTAIVAIDPMTLDNGCLHLVPGSHRNGVVAYVTKGYRFTLADPPSDDAGKAVELEAGDLLLLSSLCFHRSGPNLTDRRRRAWILQFLSGEAVSPDTGRRFEERMPVAEDGRWLDAAALCAR